MQTRNWRKKKQLLEKFARKNEAITQAKNDQQQFEGNRNFFEKFQNFYEKVKTITIPSIQFLQEQFHIQELTNDQEIYNLQQELSTQWTPKLRKNWTDDDRQILIWIVLKITTRDGLNIRKIPNKVWEEVVELLSRRTVEQCKNKWNDLLKLSLQQIPWTSEQDLYLIEIIKKSKEEGNQNKWCNLANQLNLKFKDSPRTGKQCRERWNNHLNPEINRHPWSLEEDIELLEIVKKHSKKWAFISKNLRTKRSENAVKNRYNCLLKKNHCNSLNTLINLLKNRFKQENPSVPLQNFKKIKQQQQQQISNNQHYLTVKNKNYNNQTLNQIEFKVELFDQLDINSLKQFQPAFYDVRQKIIHISNKPQLLTFLSNQMIKIESDQNLNNIDQNIQQQQEISNQISGLLNIADSNLVRYVPCLFPAPMQNQLQLQEKKSQFNIPGVQTLQQQNLSKFSQNKTSSSFSFFAQNQTDNLQPQLDNQELLQFQSNENLIEEQNKQSFEIQAIQ